MAVDYTSVTEVPGGGATAEQISMLYTRYSIAASECEGKDVLELACGSGHGLGLLAKRARLVVGGDYTESLLRGAKEYYGSRIPLIRLDAQVLPFANHSFDVVVLFEAIYYLQRAEDFLLECCRVLRPGGTCLLCSANREWAGFNPSPFSVKYFSAAELRLLLTTNGFTAEICGAFPMAVYTARQGAVERIRRMAVRGHLIPKTMKGKELFKRIFYGRLARLGQEVEEGMAERAPLFPLDGEVAVQRFKVIYAIGRLSKAG